MGKRDFYPKYLFYPFRLKEELFSQGLSFHIVALLLSLGDTKFEVVSIEISEGFFPLLNASSSFLPGFFPSHLPSPSNLGESNPGVFVLLFATNRCFVKRNSGHVHTNLVRGKILISSNGIWIAAPLMSIR